jgi:hypothetical protein
VVALFLETSRFLDLSPPDFFVWVVLKDTIYKKNLYTLEELEESIVVCVSNITVETLRPVASHMKNRVNACIAERDGRFQHEIQHCFFLFFDFNAFYFLANNIGVKNGLRDV